MERDAYAAIYRVVSRIKRGQVMTYGEVAEKAGQLRAIVGRMQCVMPATTGLNVPMVACAEKSQ